MGTYTKFNIDLQPYDAWVVKDLRDKVKYADYALDVSGDTNQPCKWYEHEKDMKEFSLLYPDTLFILSGEGEAFTDLWKLYVKNGKSKKVKAISSYPSVSPSELV